MISTGIKRNTIGILAAFLLFFSSEKYASNGFSFFSDTFPLQDQTISLVTTNCHFQIQDIYALLLTLSDRSSHCDDVKSIVRLYLRTQFHNLHQLITRLTLQSRPVFFRNSHVQFRLEIKRSNLPAFPV